MRLVKKKWKYIVAECEKCGRVHNIPIDNFIDTRGFSLDLIEVIQCECGDYHNLVLGENKQPERITKVADSAQVDEPIKCRRCNSTQLHTDKKGFSLGKGLLGNFIIGGAGLLGGLIGKDKVIITCMNCGHNWEPGK